MRAAEGAGLLARLPAVRRVAVVRASRIGDFLCATPALRALRAALPGAEITLIALPMVADLAERSPSIDRFVPFPGWPGMAEQFFQPRALTAFFAAQQTAEYDLAVQLHGSGLFSNPFTLMLGARVTAGFVRPGEPPGLLAAALPFPDQGLEVDRVLALPRFLGAPDCGRHTKFPIHQQDRVRARDLLARAEPPLVGIHPGAREAAKRWPAERFAAVAQSLISGGGTVVLLGDEETRSEAARIAGLVGGPVLDLCGRVGLGALGAVIDALSVLITNDSGPAHIAYALGAPAVVLFGPTDPAQWGPATPGPFHLLRAGTDVRAITPAMVLAAAQACAR